MNANWELSPAGFDRLLAALHPDRNRAAAEYEKLRLKITKLLEWRGAAEPEEIADRVLDRLARRIQEGEEVGRFYSYCCGIARLLLFEAQREAERDATNLREMSRIGRTPGHRALLDLLERCMERLPQESRGLVLAYYQQDRQAKIDRRKDLAERFGMPMNALRLRVHRIRSRLRNCVERNGMEAPDTP